MMEKRKKQPSIGQQQIAQLLCSLTDLPFVSPEPKKNAPYLTLDAGQGPNKNAVTVSRHRVSFMVKDFGIEEAARSRGFQTKQFRAPNSRREDTRLWFLDLTPSAILQNQDFFREMLGLAYQESKNRQEHQCQT